MDYDFGVSIQSHTHSYNYNYESVDSAKHKSYCYCGEYILESHMFTSTFLGSRCNYCNYFTKYVPTPITNIKPNIDIYSEDLYNKTRDENK